MSQRETRELIPTLVANDYSMACGSGEREVSALFQSAIAYGKSSLLEYSITRRRYSQKKGVILSIEATLELNDGKIETRTFYLKQVREQDFSKLKRTVKELTPNEELACPLPFLFPKDNLVLCEYPFDLRLPSLRVLSDTKELRSLVCGKISKAAIIDESCDNTEIDITRLRYKPESRLVLRCRFKIEHDQKASTSLSDIILKFATLRQTAHSYKLLETLSEAIENSSHLSVPHILFAEPEKGVIAVEYIQGDSLAKLLKQPDAAKYVTQAGEMLARFHQITIDADRLPSSGSFESSLEKAMEIFDSCDAQFSTRAQLLMRDLEAHRTRLKSSEQSLVHGDFHQGQLLFGQERRWLLDFDRVHWGDRYTDIGNFLAQLTLLKHRGRIESVTDMASAFISGYERYDNSILADKRTNYWHAMGLLELASKEIRRLKPDWQDTVPRLFDIAEGIAREN